MTKATETTSRLAKQVDEIVSSRTVNYGTPEENFTNIAAFWTNWIASRHKIDLKLDPVDVGVMCALMKFARLAQKADHQDSVIDAAIYTMLGYSAAQSLAALPKAGEPAPAMHFSYETGTWSTAAEGEVEDESLAPDEVLGEKPKKGTPARRLNLMSEGELLIKSFYLKMAESNPHNRNFYKYVRSVIGRFSEEGAEKLGDLSNEEIASFNDEMRAIIKSWPYPVPRKATSDEDVWLAT